MRLIDADAAVESLTEYGNGRAVYIGVEEAVRRIEQLPSAQPEIIRCKDCKSRDNDDFCTGRGFPYQLVPDDGFCDKGRKEKEWTVT